MDVDALRRKGMLPPACYRCRKPGHYSRNCPKPVDVRTLTVEDLQEILSDRLAQLDAVPEELVCLVEAPKADEDFQGSSE